MDHLEKQVESLKKLPNEQLKTEICDIIGSRCSNLRRPELIQLLKILKFDFRLEKAEPHLATDAEKGNRAKEILTVDGRTFPHPQCLADGWSSDPKLFPKINYADIFEYFTSFSVPAKKSLEAYRLVDDVIDIKIYDLSGGWILVKGDVSASQTNKLVHNPWILVRHEGEVKGGQCTCVAGLGESCSHLGGLLFYLEKVTRHGLNRDLAPTETLCAWNVPIGQAETLAGPICKFEASMRVNNENLAAPVMVPNAQKAETMLAKVKNLSSQCRLLEMFSGTEVEAEVPPRNVTPDPMDIQDGEFNDIITSPSAPTIKDLATLPLDNETRSGGKYKTMFERITNSVDDSTSELIEKTTRGQSSSSNWKEHRKGRITASMAHSVFTHYNRLGGAKRKIFKEPKSAIANVLDSKSISHLPAVQWGIKMEERAKKRFLEVMRVNHPKMRIEIRGLKVPSGMGHIGASVDGLVFCNCDDCPDIATIEVKCVYNLRYENPALPSVAKKMAFLNVLENGTITLKKDSQYFTQAQMQLGIWGLQKCYFLVWTLRGHLIIPVEFDRAYWDKLVSRMNRFYLSYIVPRLV